MQQLVACFLSVELVILYGVVVVPVVPVVEKKKKCKPCKHQVFDDTGVTVYFAGFEEGSTEEEFREIFSQFGNIDKIFIHKTNTYGMVEFDNNRSCKQAIESLHQKPPLNLYVNMARNQINRNATTNPNSSFNDDTSFNANSSFNGNSTQKPRYSNKFNNFNKKPQNDNFLDEDITYQVEDYYMDENNEFVTVFTDPITNEIYVPLRYAPSLKKVSRKVPRKTSDLDDERSSVKSDHSDRRVKMAMINDSVPKITIQRNIDGNAAPYNRKPPNTFHKKPYEKPYEKRQNDNSFKNNYAQRNEENRSPNVPNHRAGATFPKHKQFESRIQANTSTNDSNEDWGDTNSTSPPARKSVNNKVENVNAAKNFVSKSVPQPQPSTSATTTPFVSAAAAKISKPLELKTIELPNNTFTEIHVEKAVNEAVGWVTLTDNTADFSNLTIEICGIIDSAPACAPEVGKIVLAFYEELWFRAVILSTTPNIRVRYIDYGNEEVVTKDEIKQIPPEFAKRPAFALCIKLADGAPCKMVDDTTFKVKPIKKENNLTVVHVENGLYEIEKPENKPVVNVPKVKATENKPVANVPKVKVKEEVHPLNIFHELLISQIEVGSVGFLEKTKSLSKSKFVATFMPLHLADEAVKLQNIHPPVNSLFKPAIGNIMSAENEEGWHRVLLLNIENNNYEVALIDFGVVKEDVSEVRILPNQFINIPIFSCVCNAINNDDLTQIEDYVDFEITEISGNNITCSISVNEKNIDVLCTPWDPRIHQPETVPPPPTTTSKTDVVNKNTPKLEEIVLKNGEDVKLVMESDGYLYVRNKQAAEVRKRIDEFMAENGSQAAAISGKPYVGQLVTAEFESEFYRAIVTSIKNNNVTICYVDYGNEETLPFFSLKVLNDEMIKEPMSIIKIRLRNFTNKSFSVKALGYLENLSIKKITLKASLVENNVYELKEPTGSSVSDELEKLDVPKAKPVQKPRQPVEEKHELYKTIKIPGDKDPKILMPDLPLEEIPLGKGEVIFQQFNDIDYDILCVCVNNPKLLHAVHVELQSQMTKYVNNVLPANESYEPETLECVLVQRDGKWFRGTCISDPENNEYTIFLVDMGSTDMFAPKDMRRMPKEFAQPNALCNFAKFDGLPENPSPSLCDRLKSLLERNNTYRVNVVEKMEEDEYYVINFPTVIKVLKEEKLL